MYNILQSSNLPKTCNLTAAFSLGVMSAFCKVAINNLFTEPPTKIWRFCPSTQIYIFPCPFLTLHPNSRLSPPSSSGSVSAGAGSGGLWCWYQSGINQYFGRTFSAIFNKLQFFSTFFNLGVQHNNIFLIFVLGFGANLSRTLFDILKNQIGKNSFVPLAWGLK